MKKSLCGKQSLRGKQTLRRKMRSVLRSFDAEQRHRCSLDAARRLIESAPWREAGQVLVYVSTEFEIDTTPLIEAAWRADKRVCAPRVLPAQAGGMIAVPIRSWGDLTPGFRSIPEPVGEVPVDPAGIDLILVPGLAFDGRGGRLGQGGGFYDRFLADPAVRAHRCGLAFEAQVVDRLDTDGHDQRVHSLATEAGLRSFEP
jgi:5-formyltetrahydrofolate cyclo-ligase